MATDYNDRGIELGTAGRTELTARRQSDLWIANFITRVKINRLPDDQAGTAHFRDSLETF